MFHYSCNSTAKPPSTVKVLLIGGDWLQGSVLRHYVDLLGSRPPDWVNHIRFFIVPIGSSAIARYFTDVDRRLAHISGRKGSERRAWYRVSSENRLLGSVIAMERMRRFRYTVTGRYGMQGFQEMMTQSSAAWQSGSKIGAIEIFCPDLILAQAENWSLIYGRWIY